MFTTKPPNDKAAEGDAAAAAEAEEAAAPSPVEALEAQLAAQTEQLKLQKDQLLRALADAENARSIAKRDVESARQFAVTKFAKSMLDVADNLNLAMTSIPAEVLEIRIACVLGLRR
jgi:molecular chaperone GrpE